MKSFVKIPGILSCIFFMSMIINCDNNFGISDNENAADTLNLSAKEEPPGGWEQKVNNKLIARIVLEENKNCAIARGEDVDCLDYTTSDKCYVIVSYMDGTPKERWEKACDGNVLIFNDGIFSYFYGKKSNP